MIVVSDATPVNVLVQVGLEYLLRELYVEVYLHPEVVGELTHARTPARVRAWATDLPDWICVRANNHSVPSTLNSLDIGERHALALALELKADAVLIDDLTARRAAVRLGLQVAGTLGILGRAAGKGMIDYDETVARLLRLDFRASPTAIENARPGKA